MIKQDWLDYFEAVNGRSATEAEIAQALAAGEFQEEQVAQEASQFVGGSSSSRPSKRWICCCSSST